MPTRPPRSGSADCRPVHRPPDQPGARRAAADRADARCADRVVAPLRGRAQQCGTRTSCVSAPGAARSVARSRSSTAARAGGWHDRGGHHDPPQPGASTAARSLTQPSRKADVAVPRGTADPLRHELSAADPDRPPGAARRPPHDHARCAGTAAARARVAAAVRKRLTACVSGPPPSLACPLPSNRYVPGSLHGQLVGTVAHDLKFTVSSDAAGSIEATGSVAFRGRYRRADLRQHRPDAPRRGAPAGPCLGLRRRSANGAGGRPVVKRALAAVALAALVFAPSAAATPGDPYAPAVLLRQLAGGPALAVRRARPGHHDRRDRHRRRRRPGRLPRPRAGRHRLRSAGRRRPRRP